MSRFFARDSDSESESSSSDEEAFNVPQARTGPAPRTFQWSDDEDDQKRVVRSEKDKRYDELKGILKNLKNHKNIKDMAKVLNDFEELGASYVKSKKVVEKEGIPKFYIKALGELEDFVNECWEDREWRKNVSKNNAKGLTTLRQRIRKYNRDFEAELTKFRENPADYEEEDKVSDVSDKSDDEDIREAPVKVPSKEKAPKKMAADGDSDDSYDWPTDDDSSSSDSDVPDNLTVAFFLKKKPGEEEEKKEKKVKAVKKPKPQVEQEPEREDGEDEWQVVEGRDKSAVQEKPRIFPKDQEIKLEVVIKKLSELLSARGKKGTDRAQQVDILIELREIANTAKLGAAVDCKMLFCIIGAIFDYNPNIATCMKGDKWVQCLKYVEELFDCVVNNNNIQIGANISDDSENFEEEKGPLRVNGCILTTIERLDEEYIKMLQACDAHSTEYVDRLKDEPKVCEIINNLVVYLEDKTTAEEKCRFYVKKIEHLYYKFEAENSDATYKVMNDLCHFIYAKDSTDRLRTRAMLYQVYHHALHDRWFEARDLMLMSHLQDNIHMADVPTQILYNRAMVQLGLCAFRQGMTQDAHNCLVDIQSSGRAKELLAQGLLQRQHDRTAEQEKIEKRRQMPYHMHINLELLECVYLVSAMLMEIPYMAAHEFDARRRMISKNFHYRMRESDRQPLVGPPESMREHVVAASKAMKSGDWDQCHRFIINEKMNTKVWDLFHESVKVKVLLVDKIKEQSLRTYLFTYSQVYDSISLNTLAHMYEMDETSVHSIISKMIINEELMASLDEPSQCVMMHRTDPTALQSLALQLSEKVSSLVDYNERLMEMKSGNYFFQNRNYDNQQNQNYQNRGSNYQQRQQNSNYQQRQQGNQNRGRGRQNYQSRGNYQNYNSDRRQVRFQQN